MESLARAAKEASRLLARMSTAEKNALLKKSAAAIRSRAKEILAANAADVKGASGKSAAFIDRLTLDAARLEKIAKGVEDVAALPDPVGETRDFSVRPNGLVIRRMRVPLGVILIVYEARPGVTADAAALCLKSGNAAILRGGKEALGANRLIASCFPSGMVQFVDDPDREAVKKLLKLDHLIDLVVPRGGPELTRSVRQDSTIAVLSHDKGLVHVYVDEGADPAMAQAIVLNAKVERPGVCNAMETLLLHERFDAAPLLAKLKAAGVELRRDGWDEEYLDLILSVKTVKSLDEALEHIAKHGSGLAEAIVTENEGRAMRFLREVDAGAVYWNASTRFTDGGEFGLGAEMGISTQKVHARGPVGLEGLTCEKYVVTGSGQVRDSRA
jgi:glutamate-5-semialdehyde dehydrogenase